jgi:hypothetical protein
VSRVLVPRPAEPVTPAAGPLDWLGLALLSGCGALAAILELMFIPLYAGTVLVPVAAAGAVVGNVVLPRLAWALVPSMRAAAVPLLAWLLVMLAVVLLPRPEGDVLLPGGSMTWVSYGVLLGGALAGAVTLVVLFNPAPERRAALRVSR